MIPTLSNPVTRAPDLTLRRLKAIGEPLRWRVLELLTGGELCVCDLSDRLQVAQPKLSFHLKVLREAELIDVRHDHRWAFYRLRPDAFAELQNQLQPFTTPDGRPGGTVASRCC